MCRRAHERAHIPVSDEGKRGFQRRGDGRVRKLGKVVADSQRCRHHDAQVRAKLLEVRERVPVTLCRWVQYTSVPRARKEEQMQQAARARVLDYIGPVPSPCAPVQECQKNPTYTAEEAH